MSANCPRSRQVWPSRSSAAREIHTRAHDAAKLRHDVLGRPYGSARGTKGAWSLLILKAPTPSPTDQHTGSRRAVIHAQIRRAGKAWIDYLEFHHIPASELQRKVKPQNPTKKSKAKSTKKGWWSW